MMRIGLAIGMTFVLALASSAAASGAPAQREDVFWIPETLPLPDGQPQLRLVPSEDRVEDAWATLARGSSSATMTLHTNSLTPGNAYTVWWVVFNDPEGCVANPMGPMRCGLPDVLNPFAAPSHIWADGDVIKSSGSASFSDALHVGEPGEFEGEPGLVDPQGAEIQLFVRDHGPAIEGSDQTITFNGGCRNVIPGGSGTPGDYWCENQQWVGFPAP